MQVKRGAPRSICSALRLTSTPIPMTSPPSFPMALIVSLIDVPVVRTSSTTRILSSGAMSKSRRNVLVSPVFSAKALLTPSCRAVSKARTIPPVVGPTTSSILSSLKCWTMRRHSRSVYPGYCRMRNFSQYIGECRPEASRKCPSFIAPLILNSFSESLANLPPNRVQKHCLCRHLLVQFGVAIVFYWSPCVRWPVDKPCFANDGFARHCPASV